MNDTTPTTWAPPPYSENPLDKLSRDEILTKWQQLKTDIETAKQAEMAMRKYIVKRAFPEATEGTNKQDLGNGYSLKAGVKFNYNLDNDLEEVEKALDDISKMGNEGAFLADRLVQWSASFLLTEYRKLCEEDATPIQRKIKARIERVLTITEASPTLDIVAPKAKK